MGVITQIFLTLPILSQLLKQLLQRVRVRNRLEGKSKDLYRLDNNSEKTKERAKKITVFKLTVKKVFVNSQY